MSPRSNPSWGPMRKVPQPTKPPAPGYCHCDDPEGPTTDEGFDAWNGKCYRCGKQTSGDDIWLKIHPEERSPKRRGN